MVISCCLRINDDNFRIKNVYNLYASDKREPALDT